MKRLLFVWGAALAIALTCLHPGVRAFCGFYVAKADARLFNRASQVVLVRLDDKTVLTMANDFKGDPKEFAVVIPVPTFLERDQIHVTEKKLIDHLDAFTAPRLVEYFDPNPCAVAEREVRTMDLASPAALRMSRQDAANAKSLGVTIEARYTVGEYDILILSATQSSGLESWLRRNGYTVPAGASRVLNTYIKQGLKFFVAKVNLKEQAKTGFQQLRPLQMAYESPRFMLPIRLGMANADGPQEVFVYTITRNGRVEATNYRTVKLPSDAAVPEYTKDVFPKFYQAMFSRQVQKENLSVVFLEYAWDMAWCDPCAADPLSADELRKLGVFWLPESPAGGPDPRRRALGGAVDTFLTRLHVRYDGASFPEDIVFQETADRANFQGRYVLRHPWKGDGTCEAAQRYREQLRARAEQEASALAALTAWPIDDIRRRMGPAAAGPAKPDSRRWWQRIFTD
jgi:hypothetical protein